jgi:hypothetical protein
MAKIYHNNSEYTIKRAIFYGCSNTAGTELADADIFDMSLQEVNELKLSLSRTAWNNKLYAKVALIQKNLLDSARAYYDKMCNEYSYAKHLGDMLSVECVNFAEPGSSQKKILFNILSDLSKGYYKSGDVVFVGATSPVRDMIIDDTGELHNFVMSHKTSLDHLSSVYEALMIVNNEYQVALNNMILLRTIHSVLHQEKIPCVFIETHPYTPHPSVGVHSNEKFVHQPTNKPVIKQLKKIYQDTLNKINFVPVGTVYKYDGDKCAFGHAGPEHHKLFAQEVYEYLIQPK